MVDIDWVAVGGIGTVAATVIGILAWRVASKAAAEDRKHNAAQDEVDLQQGESIQVLAEAVRRIAESQDQHLRRLSDRVADLERGRDPSSSERRRKERATDDADSRKALEDLDSRLEKITLMRRDGLAGGGWSPATMDRKRVIRMTSRPKEPERKCPECGTKVANGVKRCPECDHELA